MEAAPMVLLGIDPATKTGWASYEDMGHGRHPRIRCGSIKGAADDGGSEAQLFARFSLALRDLLAEVGPRRVALELRLPSFAGGDVKDDPSALVGGRKERAQIRDETATKRQDGIRAIVLAMLGMGRPSIGLPNGIPYHEVHVHEWRKSFFGEGTRPPKTKLVERGDRLLPAGGVRSLTGEERRKWWKGETRLKAEMLAERWGFAIPNQDAADAVGIVFWLAAREGLFAARDALKARSAAA